VSEFDLAETKASAAVGDIDIQHAKPLAQYMGKHGLGTSEKIAEIGKAYAARHVVEDDVNLNMSRRNSKDFVRRLIAKLEGEEKSELEAKWDKIRKGKKEDKGGKEVGDLPDESKQKAMFDLMEEWAGREPEVDGKRALRDEWEAFKDHASGLSTGKTGNPAQQGVTSAIDLYNKWRNDERFKHVAEVLDVVNRLALDVRLEGGLITQAEYNRMLADKEFYAPLRREAFDYEMMMQKGYGAGKGLSTRIGTAAPGHEPVHVLQNVFAKAQAAVTAAEQNKVRNLMAAEVKANPKVWEGWFEVRKGEQVAKMDEDGFTSMTEKSLPREKDVSFVKDGKRMLLKPTEENQRAMSFVRAVNKLDVHEMMGPLRAMQWVNKLIRWVNITASPAFLAANAIRDPLTAAYNLTATEADGHVKEIFKEYGRSFRALRKMTFGEGRKSLQKGQKADPDAELVQRWEKAGGRISYTQSLKEMDTGEFSFEQRAKWNRFQVVRAAKAGLDRIENMNVVVENVMRLSAFTVLTKPKSEGGAGLSDSKAARISKDMTTNFTRRGLKSSAMGTWWLFFNATVQGNRQVLVNALGSRKLQGLIGGTIAFSFLVDALGRAVGEDDEDGDGKNDWDAIPAWDKERNIHFPVKVNGAWLKMPSPWVYNVVWRLGQAMGEVAAGVEGRDAPSAAMDFARMSVSSLNPVAGPSWLQALAPTAAKPGVQITTNEDFAGNPLAPTRFPGDTKPASQMAWSSTPEKYKYIAEKMNEWTGGNVAQSGMVDVSPSTYKVINEAITGGLGRFMTQLGETAWAAVDEDETAELKDVPIVRQFAVTPKDTMGPQLYHERQAKVEGATKALDAYTKGPDRNVFKAREIRAEDRDVLGLAKFAKDAERQIKSLRKRMRAAEKRGDERGVERYKARIKQVQRRFNTTWERQVG